MEVFLLKVRIFFIFLAFFTLLTPSFSAKIKIVEQGHINISSGFVANLTIIHEMPQESEFLSLLNISVAPSIFSMERKKDSLGNQYLEIHASSLAPGNYTYRITYLIETREKLFFKYPKSITFNKTFSGFGNLTEPSPEIIKYSYENFFGNSLTSKIYFLVDFVREFIEYDYNYSDVVLSAKEIGKRKKGTCDEFAIFFSSLLNAQQISNRIVYGYAYSNNSFRAHAWNEIYLDNKWYPVDILFKEFFYLDSLHIPFYYSKGEPFHSKISITGYNVSYQWKVDKARIEILERDQEKVRHKLRVNMPLKLEGYDIITLNFKPGFCNEYSFEISPCVNKEGKPALHLFPEKISIPLCNETELYFLVWPGLFSEQYICPVSLYVNGKKEREYKIEVNSNSLDKLYCAIKRKDNELSILYPDLNFYLLTNYGIFGKDTARLKLPGREGVYKVWIYKEGKACDEIFPVSQKEFIKISEFEHNLSAYENQNFSVYFCVRNEGEPTLVHYILEYGSWVHSGEVFLDKDKEYCKKEEFTALKNYNEIKLIAKSKGNFDVRVGYIQIQKNEIKERKISGWLYERILYAFNLLASFFARIFS